MPAITPSFMMDLQSRMTIISENEYARLTNAKHQWWRRVVRTRTTDAAKDILLWLLSTAQIHDQGKGGNIRFDSIVSAYTTIEHRFAGSGLKLSRAQLTDTDGQGVNLAAAWSRDISAQMIYYPQKLAGHFLKNAHTPGVYTSYDEKPFFATDHPLNVYTPAIGTFANLFTGAAAGDYPGALPIDDSVPLDTAIQNLQKALAYIASIKMPNGEDPRYLDGVALIVPPRMAFRAAQITGAKYMAQTTSAGGAATADVEAAIRNMGMSEPVVARELAGFENDKTYFIATDQLDASELGAAILTERDAFQVLYYGPQDQAVLNRADEFEWHCKGRNGLSAGHPYALFKFKAT